MHDLSGHCLSCAKIFNRYPHFNEELRTWFSALQIEHPEAHVSCAGRGMIDQESAFQRGASKAHFGESAHNYNAAIDIFCLKDGLYNLDKDWFSLTVHPLIYPALNWYGGPDAVFYERPHIEIRDWKNKAKEGLLKLVE